MPIELSHPPAPVLQRGKSPGQPELAILLGQMPAPAVIVDTERAVIYMANKALAQMSAFPTTELQGALLMDLLPGVNLAQLASGGEQSASLRRRRGDLVEVILTPVPLSAGGEWLFVRIESQEQSNLSLAQMREMFLSAMLELTRLTDEPDLEHALLRGIETARNLFQTDLVCIYQAESDLPRLARFASPQGAAVFPDNLSSTDLIRLSTPNVWTPGKRVQAEVHRFGRISNLTYVATTPLGEGKALFGLLVIGHHSAEASVWVPGMIEIVGAYISLAIEYFLLGTNLRKEIDQINQRLTTYTTVLEASQEGIILVSPQLTILELNPTAEWMLGYANWETQNQPVENILIGPERLIPSLEAACSGVPTHNIGNVSLHRRNGQSFPAHLQTIPVSRNGEVQAVIVFISDVSVREQIKQRTTQLEHRAILGDVTAVFAHEVRNPINNISTGLQLMASRMSSGDPNLDILTRMENDCTRLTHLMESVLAFSRPMEPKFEPVNIVVLLQRLFDRWRPRLARVNVEPFFAADESTPLIWADPRALEQVFTNLISNAVEAMSNAGGTLALRIALAQETSSLKQVVVSVSDNGPGIPDDLRDRIFEPFLTSKRTGTGLGLAITKRIVTAHHGTITLDSFPGGTVFHVLLPIYQGDH